MTSKEALIYCSKAIKDLNHELGEDFNEKDYEALQTLKRTIEENKKLKEIIKENFGYSENRKECYFKYDNPVMEDEIKEVLEND